MMGNFGGDGGWLGFLDLVTVTKRRTAEARKRRERRTRAVAIESWLSLNVRELHVICEKFKRSGSLIILRKNLISIGHCKYPAMLRWFRTPDLTLTLTRLLEVLELLSWGPLLIMGTV